MTHDHRDPDPEIEHDVAAMVSALLEQTLDTDTFAALVGDVNRLPHLLVRAVASIAEHVLYISALMGSDDPMGTAQDAARAALMHHVYGDDFDPGAWYDTQHPEEEE